MPKSGGEKTFSPRGFLGLSGQSLARELLHLQAIRAF